MPVPLTAPTTVLIDVVASRDAADRRALHDLLTQALADVNGLVPGEQPLRPTVGDEAQGVFTRLGEAIRAAVLLRGILGEIDVRTGIGRGEIEVLDPDTGLQDGPGWWAAREAIEDVEAAAGSAQHRGARLGFASEIDPPAVLLAVGAALRGLDALWDAMGADSRTVTTSLLLGRTQSDVAHHLGVSASAVSQRVRRDHIGDYLAMVERLVSLD